MPDSALKALEQSAARETDDEVLANIVTSAFTIMRQDTRKESRAVTVIAGVLQTGRAHTIHAASILFGLHTDALPLSLLAVILASLERVNAEHKSSLNNIDYGISHLITAGEHETGISVLAMPKRRA